MKLTAAQPWFIQQVAHTSFLAVHRATVEQFGAKWTEAANIVTNGPFKLEAWQHNSSIDLVKNEEWRDADNIALTRVNGRMISDAHDARCRRTRPARSTSTRTCRSRRSRGSRRPTFYEQYPALGTYIYGFNVENITDVNQRQAMSLAINRREIIDNIAQEDQLPGDGLDARGHAGLRRRSTPTRSGCPRTATSSRRSS